MDQKEIISFLKNQSIEESFIEKLKINYRPVICPLHKLIEMVEPEDAVFDIGCGSGQFALLLAEFSKPKEIYGIEIKQHLVDNAQTLLSKYSDILTYFELYDGMTIPDHIVKSSKVFMIDVLHHIPKPNQINFLNDLYQKMRVGSRFILKDIDKGNPFVLFNKMHDLVFSREIGNEISLNQISKVLTDIGFKLIISSKERMYVYPHYTIVVEK